MFRAILFLVKGILSSLFLALNTIFWCLTFYPLILLKIIIPLSYWRAWCTKGLEWISERWIDCNRIFIGLLQNTQWQITGGDNLSRKDWYLLTCNHQSWTDIFILQWVLTGKIPPFKVFIKQNLFWVPLLGIAWWGLDCPFMKRYSKEQIAKNPSLRKKDVKTIQQKCARFKHKPVTILNFLEGTRFTKLKHSKQESPYEHLLLPKPGGIAYVLEAMENKIQTLIDVTITYPDGKHGFWDFISGKTKRVIVNVATRAIPAELLNGNYASDSEYRVRLKAWLLGLWQEKDQVIKASMA